MTFQYDDIRRVTASLAGAGPRVRQMGSLAVGKTLKDIERSAKERAPVDTGNLKDSIGVTRHSPLSGEVGPTAEYGYWVEMGTSRMAPQPYMAPAADIHLPLFEQAIVELGGEILNG